MSSERRRHERHAINRTATFRSGGDPQPRECVIADISKYGARLFVGESEVPDQFELIASAGGLSRQCKVVWRLNDEIGVTFMHDELPEAESVFA